ncbi:liprin-alpha-1 isoform a, partial [Lynx pardinus]
TADQNRQLQERVEVVEQKMQQTLRKAMTLCEVEAKRAQMVAALCNVGPTFPPGSHNGNVIFMAVRSCISIITGNIGEPKSVNK